jgi:hypothetical protein
VIDDRLDVAWFTRDRIMLNKASIDLYEVVEDATGPYDR